MYSVQIDLDRSIIDTALAGFLSAEDVQGYVRDVQAALILNQFYRGYALIVDVGGCAIQPQATLSALAQHMAAMPKARRIAVVVGTTPAISQVRRLFRQDYARIVPTRQHGLAWILSGIDPATNQASLNGVPR
jgi:hypothetical protein